MTNTIKTYFSACYTYCDTQRITAHAWISNQQCKTREEAEILLVSSVYTKEHEILTGMIVEMNHD
ncbi:hypothetical protein [Serratia fonticola]|uniref:hypothetical protein n=1 Tax=Serratia fonticola TaxID=47917 RepID=UPI001377AEFC|nr:hypothetical protein [Serratia fonticola]NCG50165.1 hypothetical protein [Serratia fonticola]